MEFTLFFFLSLSLVLSSFGATSNRERKWSSLEFLISGVPNNRPSEQCAEKSIYYCLLGFQSNQSYSDRISRKRDLWKFEQLIYPIYKAYSFFTFDNIFDCCKYQMRMYWRQGMKKGLSPENYIKKLTDMTEKGKQLNWIKADFNETSCLNVISQVGFGQGALRIEGNFRRSLDFLLVLQESKEMHKFSSGDIKQVLTFYWFKLNVVCMAKPWMCYS